MDKRVQIGGFISLKIDQLRFPGNIIKKAYLLEFEPLRRISRESLLKSSESSQGPQASEGDVLGGTDRLDHCRRAEYYSSEDAGSSRDMHTEPQKEDCSRLDCS